MNCVAFELIVELPTRVYCAFWNGGGMNGLGTEWKVKRVPANQFN